MATEPLAANPSPALPASDCAWASVTESACTFRLSRAVAVLSAGPACRPAPTSAAVVPPTSATATEAPAATEPDTLTPRATACAWRLSLAETSTAPAPLLDVPIKVTPSPKLA